MRVQTILNRLVTTAGDVMSVALPPHCPGCEAVLDKAEWLCDGCREQFEALCRVPSCRRCASPLPDAAGPCGRCRDSGISNIQSISRLSTFESITRELIHGLKYGRRWSLGSWLAERLMQQPRVRESLSDSDVVVPVPLHWTKYLSRGFNQAEFLARELSAHYSLRVVAAIQRIRRTTSQTAFHSRAARQKNLDNAFRLVRPDLLESKRVLLVDDVMTSGATLQAVSRTILAGCSPAAIRAVVIASANPLHTDLAP